jgi:hypothetical protein
MTVVSAARPASSEPYRTGGRHLAAPAYFMAVLFVVTSLLDAATLAYPFNPGAVAWRFGTVGAASNYILTTCFGVFLGLITAAWYEHRRTLRAIALFAALLGVLLLALVSDFALSVLQLRGQVPEQEVATYRIGSAKAGAKYVLFAISMFVMALAGWRIARRGGARR